MSNKSITRHHQKKAQEHAVIAMIATFALLTCSILSTNDTFACVPTTREKSGWKPQTDTGCFPDEIEEFDNHSNIHLIVLDSQFSNSNIPTDNSVDIEPDELFVKGCKGGTVGEVHGKPGVHKE